jgi:hypothetical protein
MKKLERNAKITALARKGVNPTTIAARLGLARSVVTSVLKRARKAGEDIPVLAIRVPDDGWEAVLVLLAAGWTFKRIKQLRRPLPSGMMINHRRRRDPAWAERYTSAATHEPHAEWSEAELTFLMQNFGSLSTREISAHLKRTRRAVERKISFLRKRGETFGGREAFQFHDADSLWLPHEIAFMKANSGHVSPKNMLPFLRKGRTWTALYKKLIRLGLPGNPNGCPRKSPGPREVFGLASSAVPAKLPRHVRDDVIGSLALAVLEGEVGIHEIKEHVASTLTEYYRMHPTKYGPQSLDAPVYGDGDKTPLVERIADDQKIW